MRVSVTAALALASALVATQAAAQDGAFAIGAQAGTTGVGLEAQYKVNDKLRLRGAVDTFKFDEDVDGDDIAYAGEIDFSTAGLFVDYHPFGSSFFVSGGAYFGDRKVTVSGTPAAGSSDIEIGDESFTSAEVGTLSGEVDFGGTAPFVGLGWNTTFTGSGNWGFKFLAGAAFGKDADATLARVGGAALSPATQAELNAALREEEQEIEDELDGFKAYPVIQVGLAYRF